MLNTIILSDAKRYLKHLGPRQQYFSSVSFDHQRKCVALAALGQSALAFHPLKKSSAAFHSPALERCD